MKRKYLFCSALSVMLSVGFTVIETSYVAAATVPTEASAQPSGTIDDISDLVKEFFPKSKITKSEKSLHFEFKAHERLNTYSNKLEMSPDLGGVIGDVQVKPGESKDKDKLPTERHEGIHSVLLMAPYSAPVNSHLETRLVFQPDTPNDFMLRFREVVNSYKKGEVPSAATMQSADPKANHDSASKLETSSTNPTPPAAKDASADSKVQTNASPATTSLSPITTSVSPATTSGSPATTSASSATTPGSPVTTSASVETASASPQSSATNSGATFGAAKMSKYPILKGVSAYSCQAVHK